ncbi:hypothetical protein ACFH04_06895 [Streptomyces noboritoensis]|uniref:Integral membrane protein n=1 Tax=Streptomyces noboritoensis TaxID=67337 RepID=A0ABV6TCE4_9ACTN
MTSSPWGRIRHGIAAASVALALITIACGVIALALAGGVPAGWWPHTGQAFDPAPDLVQHAPCAVNVGPADGALDAAGTAGAGATGAVAGVVGLVVWQVRCPVGPGRG